MTTTAAISLFLSLISVISLLKSRSEVVLAYNKNVISLLKSRSEVVLAYNKKVMTTPIFC